MKKYLKYDLISNKKFFVSTFIVFAIFFIALISVKAVGSLSKLIEINSAIYSLEIILGLILLMVLIWFIFSSFYKEFYTRRGVLTFSLPLSFKDIIQSKFLVINLFYFTLSIFIILVNLFVGNFNLILLGKILLFLFILENFLSGLILFSIFIDRFKDNRVLALTSLIIFPISILGLIFFRSFNGDFKFLDMFTYGYFLALSLILFFVNTIYIGKNFDLS
ncbi:MAG: hypothetical protein ACTIH2_07405 [Anaerococcus sp.]